MPVPADPDALDDEPTVLGTLDAGPLAGVGRGGVVTWDGGRLSWWVGAEDRWHRPEGEASERRRRIDGAPVVETAVRVPGGDVTGTAYGAVVDGGRPGVVVEVTNATAVPVALAVVVESDRDLEVGAAGVAVGPLRAGAVTVRTSRDARDRRRAVDAESLLAQLGEGSATPANGSGAGPGAVALVLPLPHTAVARVSVVGGAPVVSLDEPAADLPESERVLAGWARLVDRAPRVDAPDPGLRPRWVAALCDTVLGAPDTGPEVLGRSGPIPTDGDDANLGATVRRATALARCGLLDEADPLVDAVLGAVRRDGSLGGDDPLGATAGLLVLADALWSGGVEPVAAEQLVGPVARAARWLEKGRRRPSLAGREAEVAAALVAPVGLLDDLEQPDLAEHLARVAAALAPAAGGGGGRSAEPEAADHVVDVLDRFVRDVPAGLRLGAGWEAAWAGQPVEVHDLPSRWGPVSWALRWHGARPALLWEVRAWGDRPAAAGVTVTTPTLDPEWSDHGRRGDALLAAPEVAAPVASPPPGGGTVADGATFS